MSRRPLCQAAVLVILGVVAYEMNVWQLLLFTIAAVELVLLVRKRYRQGRWLIIAATWLVVGMVRTDRCQPDDMTKRDGETVTVEGCIYDRQTKDDTTILYVKDVVFIPSKGLSQSNPGSKSNIISKSNLSSKSNTDSKHNTNSKSNTNSKQTTNQKEKTATRKRMRCIIYCEDDQVYPMGSIVEIKGRLSTFQPATNPGQFDAELYYRSLAMDFALYKPNITILEEGEFQVKEGLYKVREVLHEKLDAMAGRHASVLQAMLLGEKSQMDSEIKELYQKNGISHILVISGLHFSTVGMGLYGILRKRGLSFVMAGGISATVLLAYGLMTGFGVSALRAFVMFLILIGADIAGRGYDMASALGGSVLCLVLNNPFVIGQTGFLLSVGAIVGIVFLVPVMGKLFGKKRLAGRLLSGILSGVAVQLVTLPVLLSTFYECAPYSVLLNCIVLPFTSVVMFASIGALALGLVTMPLAKVVILPALLVLEGYQWLCRLFEKFPSATVVTGKPELYRVVIYYGILVAGFAMVVRLLKKRGRLREETGQAMGMVIPRVIVLVWIIMLLALLCAGRNRQGIQMCMLDVGQGQSIHISCDGNNMLFDGGSSDVSQVGKYRIAPYLKSCGVGKLDVVIVSHADSDHCNGVLEMLEEDLVEIECLILPKIKGEVGENYKKLQELANENGIKVERVSAGDSFGLGGAVVSVLHPSESYAAGSVNDGSVVISVRYKNCSAIFTGDVEAGGERSMLKNGKVCEADILQVAHHGSDSSNTAQFLGQVSPKIALISCGANNSYGHPKPDVLKRLKQVGSFIFQTPESGAITVKMVEDAYVVEGFCRADE